MHVGPDAVAGRVHHAQRDYGRERLRYPLCCRAGRGAYYGAAQLVFALEVAGPVAAVVWLPVGVGVAFLYLGGPAPVARRADRATCSSTTTARSRSARRSLQTCRQPARGASSRCCCCAASCPPARRSAASAASWRMLAALAAGAAASATIGSLAQLAGGVIDAGAHGARSGAPGGWATSPARSCSSRSALAGTGRRRGRWSERPLEGAAAADRGRRSCAELVSRSNAAGGLPRLPGPDPAPRCASARAARRWRSRSPPASRCGTRRSSIGPFVDLDSITDSVLNTQLFIAVAALTSFCLAAVVRRARGDRRGPARVARPPRRGLRHRAAPARPQPPRRRAAAALGARRAPPPRGRRRAAASEQTAALIVARRRRAVAGDRGAARARARAAARRCSTKLGLAGAIRSIAARAVDPGHARCAAGRPARRHRRGDRVLRHRRGGHQRPALRARVHRSGSAPSSRHHVRRGHSWPTTASAARTRA